MQHPDIQPLDQPQQLRQRSAVVMIQIRRAGDVDMVHDDAHLFHHLCFCLMVLLAHVGRVMHLMAERLQDAHIAALELIKEAAHICHDQYPLHRDPSRIIHLVVWLTSPELCQDVCLEIQR